MIILDKYDVLVPDMANAFTMAKTCSFKGDYIMKKLNVLIALAVFIFMVVGVLIPYAIIGNGVSSLPEEKQKYGEAAIRSAYMVLDHPLQNFLARRLEVQSVNIDDLTGKIDAEVKAYTFWGVPVARIKMSGRIIPEDSVNMGFSSVWID